jgi:hypothetical protein
MKLYITPGSPYARLARIMVLEKALQHRVEVIVAETRTQDSPYYAINPSGRVPFLLRDDGTGLEESALICRYLDHLDGQPAFDIPATAWEPQRLTARATSLMDGLSVWVRELRRPPNEQSPGILRHEAQRALRLLDLWEAEIAHPAMQASPNMPQLTLACALGMAARLPDLHWQPTRPALATWFARLSGRPSVAQTVPA